MDYDPIKKGSSNTASCFMFAYPAMHSTALYWTSIPYKGGGGGGGKRGAPSCFILGNPVIDYQRDGQL